MKRWQANTSPPQHYNSSSGPEEVDKNPVNNTKEVVRLLGWQVQVASLQFMKKSIFHEIEPPAVPTGRFLRSSFKSG